MTQSRQDLIATDQAQQAALGQGVQVVVYPQSQPSTTPGADPPAAQTTATATASNLPARNAGFVGRDGVLDRMQGLLREHGRVVTRPRDRMGGVGKTQLAIEYGHRFRAEYDVTWLIPAEQNELIGGQLTQLAVEAGLVNSDVTTPAVVQALHTAIRLNPRWLLIFDNAEDPETLAAWLPPQGGHIVITSRSLGWDEIAAPIDVDLFSRDESVALLQRRIRQLPATEADRLAKELGDLPLALAQAASFMAESGMPTSDYLEALNQQAADVLALGKPHLYPSSLTASVHLAADRLAQDNPAANQLLEICTMLAPEPILSSFFTKSAAVLPEPLASAAANRLRFPTVVKSVCDHGLASTVHQGIQIHRLIQAIIRDRVADPVAVRDCATAILVAIAPEDTDHPATWPTWALTAPHLSALNPVTSDDEQLRTVSCRFVLYLLRRAETRAALELADELRRAWRAKLGPDHPHTLKITTEYAHALYALGNIHETHPIIADTLARYRRTLGDNHPDTLRSANDLAVSFFALGKYQQARDLHQDTHDRSRQVLGEDHPRTVWVARDLAASLNELGEFDTAHALYLTTLDRSRRILGDDHPDTLWVARQLAITLEKLGQHQEARALHEDTLSRCRRVLGDDHPHTLWAQRGLAINLASLGRRAQARDMAQDVLNRSRQFLGDDHPDTLSAAHSLALMVHATGPVFLARQLIDDVLKRRRRVLGPDHPDTLRAQQDQQRIVRAMGGRAAPRQRQPKR